MAAALSAQNQLPLHPSAQRHLHEKAPQMLAHLNKVLQPLASKGVEERGGISRLDSTVTYTNYTQNDSVPAYKIEFNYLSDNMTVQTEYIFNNGWERASRTAQTTDNLDRTILALSEVFENGVWVPDSKAEVFPHGNSLTLTDSFAISVWDADLNQWTPALVSATSYDDQDRAVVIFTQFNDFLGQDLALLDELSYDANGDNFLTIQSIFDQGEWTPFTRIETEFENHQPVVSTSNIIIDDMNTLPQTKTETEYTPTGQTGIIREYTWSFDTFDWVLEQTTGYLYDNENRVWSEVVEVSGGDIPTRTWKQTGYYDGDDIHFEANHNWDFATNTWVLLDKTFFYYSNTTSSNDVVNAGPLPMSPNPTTGFVRLPALDDARVTVLSAQGTAVQPAQVSLNNGRIDISNLPAGVYYVSVQKGNQRQTGAIVKQ
jgi:hypothetical protein